MEFALIAVLFFTLLVSVIEGGRLFVLQASLASAAREAARELAINNVPADALTRAGAAYIGADAPNPQTLQGCPTPPVPGANARVVLTDSPGLLTGMLNVTIQLRGTGVMRCGG